jgi:predicted nucleotidyltransferase
VEDCGRMIIGITRKKIKKEIVSIIIKANVQAVYSFGSFFRDSSFSDVDIIIV